MIKYFCNKCNNEVQKSDVLAVNTQSADGTKKAYHLCENCKALFLDFMSNAPKATDETTANNTDEGASDGDEYAVAEKVAESHETEESSSDTGRPPRSERIRLMDKMETCVTSSGVSVEDLFNQDAAIVYMDRISADMAYRYLIPNKPEYYNGGRRNIAELFGVLIAFYRGRAFNFIKQRFLLTTQPLCVILAGYASMSAYERWFGKPLKIYNKAGVLIDIGEVLAAVENKSSYRDLEADTRIDDPDQLFQILEYYLNMTLNENVRKKYISDVGGR